MSETTSGKELQNSPANAASAESVKEKEVRTSYDGLDERIKDPSKSVAHIRVICEKELSQAFRLGDARKDAVISAVNKVLSQKLSAILCKHLVGQKHAALPADCEVNEILREADLTTPENQELCLDRKLEQQHVIQKLCELCECAEGDLAEETVNIEHRAGYFETKWREVREDTKKLQLQVNRLAVCIKKFGILVRLAQY